MSASLLSGQGPLYGVNVGDVVTYWYEVTNTADVTVYDVTVVDDIYGPVTLDETTLAQGESTTARLTREVNPL